METGKTRRYLIACIVVTLFTLLPVVRNGFVNWDDNLYVYENPAIRTLSPAQVKSFFTSFYAANYHPLVLVSYAVEYRFFGLDPRPYHITNLTLHLTNCALVFWLIYLISRGNPFVSAGTALLFGIHPLHVEPVAWISGRKDVLYAFFFLAAAIAYIRSRGRQNGSVRMYGLSLVFFLCSLLSKPMAVTLPALLLLLIDWYWSREKLSGAAFRLIPFFAFSATAIALTARAQSAFNALRYDRILNLADNVMNAARGLVFYLAKTLVPVGLSCRYPPLDEIGGMLSPVLAAAVPILALLTVIVWVGGRYNRNIVFGAIFFLVTILPVLQLVPVGRALPADRYTYLPLIGLFYIAAEGVGRLLATVSRGRVALKLGLLAGLITLSVMSWNQTRVWKDSITLWSHVLQHYDNLSTAYYNRGLAHRNRGDYDSALADYNRAITLCEDCADVYNNRANIYLIRKQYEAALKDYSLAIQLMSEEPANEIRNRDLARVYTNRGILFLQQKSYDLAVSDVTAAVRLVPDFPEAYGHRAKAHAAMGRFDLAAADCTRLIGMNAQDAKAFYNRAYCHQMMGDQRRARADLDRARSLGLVPDPRVVETICEETRQ
ncbi:MAG: tetratricopeptide repeat protein [Thermodesulfobacteriota bacterium]